MRTSLFSHRIHRRGNGRRILSRSLTSLFVPVILAAGLGQSMPEVNGAVTATETSGALNVTLGAANDTGEILTFNSDTEFHVFGTGFGLQDFSGVTRINVALGSSNQVVTLDSTNASFEPSVNFSGGGATDTLVKAGGNTVILTGAATFGNTNLNGGTLEIGGGGTTGSISGNINISSSTADLVFARSNAITYSGIITGSGNVIQAGSGTLTLTGTNNFSGGIFIESGVVSVSNALALGAGHVTLDFGGELTATGTVTVTKEADFLSGVGKVSTSGTLTLNSVDIVGSSTMTVGSAGHTGTVVVGNGGMLASGASSIDVAFGTLANGGGLSALTQQASTTTVAAGAKLDLRESSIEVQRLVNEGSVILGTKAATTLTIDAGAVDTAISGAGQVEVKGTVFYAGANTYTGGTTIFSGGQLFVGNGATGSIVGNVVNNGALTFQRNGYTFGGQISGTGSVTITDGAVTLSGNNSYQGGTTTFDHLTITNGNALGTGDVTVNDGRELSATGTVTLANTVQAPNRSILSATGTLTINSLNLGTTSQLKIGSTGHTGTVVLGVGGVAGMSPSATIDVAFGTLANGGRMNFFTGAASSTTVEAGATLDLRDGSVEVNSLLGEGSVKLGTLASTTLTLDAAGFNGVISGAGNVVVNGSVFYNSASTYTGGTTVNPGGQLFVGDGATGSLVGNIIDNGIVYFRRSAYTFAGTISGTGSVENSFGPVTLSGNNTYQGGTTIHKSLTITNANALGTGAVTLDGGGELSAAGAMTLANTVSLTPVGSLTKGTLSTTGTFTIGSLELGTTSQLVVGSTGHTGTVVLANGGLAEMSPSATIDVAFGTLANGGRMNFFTDQAASTTVEAGATLDLRDGSIEVKNLQGAGSVKLGTQASTLLTIDAGTFSGVISGAGRVSTIGNVFLYGANTYTGGTTVPSGSELFIGNGATGSVAGNITLNDGSVSFDRTNSYTYAGLISGSGRVVVAGSSLTLTGNNTFAGGTIIAGNLLKITNANAIGTGPVTMSTFTELSTVGSFTLTNAVASIGPATLSTTGTFTVSNLQLASGAQFFAGSAGHTGTVVLGNGGSVMSNASTTLEVVFGTLANGGGLNQQTANASFTTVDAGATLDLRDGNIEIKKIAGAGTVKLGAQAATTLTLDAGTFSGVISGAGQVIDGGNVTLTGTNTYTGGTQAGNLHLGTGGTTGSIVGNVTINGSLTVDRSNAFTLAGLLSGAGSLTKQGAGLLTLTGNNSFSGGTTIQEGVISMSNGNALGTGSVTLDNGTELTTTGNFTLPNTIATTSGSAKISTTGTLTLGSLSLGAPIIFGSAGHTGTIVVSKTGAFTGVAGGTIDVAFGTLRDGNSLGTFTSFVNSTTVEAPATLDLNDQNVSIKNLLGAGKVKLGINSATALTLSSANFSGVISGAGHLNIAGNTTLAGASTYTGGTSITSGVATVRNTSGSATGTGAVAISSGASLGGTGHITGAVTLNSGGEIQPGQNTGAGSTLHLGPLLWNGGGTLGFDIGSVGDEVAIGGALTKGSAGQFTIDILNDGIGLTAHNFTLMTFTSSTFSLSDFQLELPANVTGTLVLTATSLQLQNLHDPPADRPLASGFTDSGSMADPIGTSTLSTDASAGSVLTASAESLVTAPTPEPTSILLLACGTLPVVARRRRM